MIPDTSKGSSEDRAEESRLPPLATNPSPALVATNPSTAQAPRPHPGPSSTLVDTRASDVRLSRHIPPLAQKR
ncbi:hypothetical protein BaRGS_00006550 [Batillaria attramentaria]|uniref:Histone H3 n=1 Tax=Batillaria attramentaria TaxID=370345 RepID=A0ABD0LSQ4_9CAEN